MEEKKKGGKPNESVKKGNKSIQVAYIPKEGELPTEFFNSIADAAKAFKVSERTVYTCLYEKKRDGSRCKMKGGDYFVTLDEAKTVIKSAIGNTIGKPKKSVKMNINPETEIVISAKDLEQFCKFALSAMKAQGVPQSERLEHKKKCENAIRNLKVKSQAAVTIAKNDERINEQKPMRRAHRTGKQGNTEHKIVSSSNKKSAEILEKLLDVVNLYDSVEDSGNAMVAAVYLLVAVINEIKKNVNECRVGRNGKFDPIEKATLQGLRLVGNKHGLDFGKWLNFAE